MGLTSSTWVPFGHWRHDVDYIYGWLKWKIWREIYMGPMHLLVIMFNLYFLLTVRYNKDLHNHDYVLISLQCFLDLLLTGFIGLIHYFLELWTATVGFCELGGFLRLSSRYSYYSEELKSYPKWSVVCRSGLVTGVGLEYGFRGRTPIDKSREGPMSNLYTATVFIRLLLDISTFWTQLLISLAVALERFVNISLGAEANNIMRPSRRKKFYAAIGIACLFVPVVIFIDFVINMEQFRTDNKKDISDGISTCANCLRYKIQQNLRPGLPISLVVIVLCAYLYIRCAITLKKSTITRKGLLTKAFAAILFFWIVMVLPHVIFIDFWMKGGFFCIF
ncbi:uncharacterized protein LOC134844751 [Symsagittifera roscoffensis]|uniref:uncharacterized protein LOC134844751 n=1 Tax=Symsagittifera roscoffensis TaxID=84072 RepID=UPI00307C9C08